MSLFSVLRASVIAVMDALIEVPLAGGPTDLDSLVPSLWYACIAEEFALG
jgi:hypothetical protein